MDFLGTPYPRTFLLAGGFNTAPATSIGQRQMVDHSHGSDSRPACFRLFKLGYHLLGSYARAGIAAEMSPNEPPLRALSAESSCSRAAKLGDCLSARWLMKVHHSLATYHGGVADMNKRCAMWLPTFFQRGIHFFGERTEVLAFNNFVLFDRVHPPIIGKRAAVVEEDLLSVRESARARSARIRSNLQCAPIRSAVVWRRQCCRKRNRLRGAFQPLTPCCDSRLR